jgi:hypothetical protein
VLIDLLDEPRDVLVGLRAKRRRDHPASILAREVIQRDRDLICIPDGEPATSTMACLPFRLTAVGLDQPGRYAAFVLKPIHLPGIAQTPGCR